jgi:hypothetical protein
MADARVWKVRARKTYADETNHVIVGEIVEEAPQYLKMRCRTFHFKRPMVNASIAASEPRVRLFPWSAIAYVTEILEPIDWERARAQLDEKGDVVLKTASGTDKAPIREGLDS